jgi:HSP20 family protein
MNSIVKSNQYASPWRDFLNLDNFFDNSWTARSNFPAVNVSESDKNYSVELIAPGFKKEDFKLHVEDDILTISAETKTETPGNGKQYSRREYSYNSFSRSFQLPDNVKDDAISASYNDGVLTLDLPKSEKQVKATKEISIK